VESEARKLIVIKDKYQQVIDRIHKAARNAGRNPDDIKLVVVTKTQPIDVIRILIGEGVTNFGENYVEEAVPKIESLEVNKELQWHMIGHVQSRKAQSICDYFQFLHSLDSIKLAEKLCRCNLTSEKPLTVWMEFNVSGEEAKYGWNIMSEENWKNILPDIEKILESPYLNIVGLMTIPPYSNNPEASRPHFRLLRKFQEYIVNHFQLTDFRELSIGMSADFEVAIQEGSTCVRIGQAILGPRPG
jgi:PLP dependent protein